MTVFAAAFFVSVVGAPSITALSAISARSASISMWSSIAGFATAVVFWFTLGDELGALAIAIGYLIGSVLQVISPVAFATKRFEVVWGSFPIRLLMIVVAVALVIDSSAGLRYAAIVASMVALLPEYRLGVSMIRH